MERVIVGIAFKDEDNINLRGPFRNGIVTDILYKRDGLAKVTTGAPVTYMYQVTVEHDVGPHKCIHHCFPFDQLVSVSYVDIEEAKEEPAAPEIVE